jgi:linoleoyl-CoA desaturase
MTERTRAVFSGGGEFHLELRERAAEFLTPARVRRGRRLAVLKTGLIMGWALGSYLALLLWARSVWSVAPLALSLALALAGIGFAVAHDANHGALLGGRRRNRILGLSFDLIGASSYIWRAKHNLSHHSYTNIVGGDADIDQLPLLRLAPDQARRGLHRFQYLYAWPIYGLFALRYHLFGDIKELVNGKVTDMTPLAKPRGAELVFFIAGKAVFWSWALVVPLLVAPWWAVLITFVCCSWVLGFTTATVFQLAHSVDEAAFTSLERMRGGPRAVWAVHQVESTVDFATQNRLLSWYLGGLNFQIEHHLFPGVSHVHYPHLYAAVRETCARHGVRHYAQPSLAAAVASHGRWLREMGRSGPGVGAAAATAS